MAAAAPSPLFSSVEKTNGAKLSRLLIDGGTTVLRNVFDSHHPPANLAANLNVQYKTLLSLFRRRILNKSQWDKLFPPSGANPDSKTFDITLLFLLLTNICGLTPPPSGWHSKPPTSDTSPEANLARIKFFRNELYGHVTTTGVDRPTFNALWQEISAVLVSLGLNQAEIDRLEAERCGEGDYLGILHEWADSEQDVKLQLKDIRQCQTETRQDVTKVLESQKEDHKTLQDTIFKLEGVCQSQTKTHQTVKEVHETLQAGFHEVNQKVEHLKKRREMESAEELLRNLAKSEFKGDIEYHAQRFQEGTREWIFKRVEDWLGDGSSPNRAMVISGDAGMGKSVVSAVVCKRMQETGRLSGSHFCQHNNVRYRNPQLMLQSLASHLSCVLPEYKKALVEQLSRNLGTEINYMGVEELFSLLFKEPLSTIADPGRNILMVIDALDESEYRGRNELLDVIANHFCKLPLWIRFLMTTRPEVNIVNSVKSLQPLQLESNDAKNKADIQLFFEKRLSQVIPSEDQDVILNKLVEKSEGVILYASFLVEFLEDNITFLTQKGLDSSLPLGIASVYQSYFKRLEKQFCKELELDEDKFLSFLSVVMAAKEPLPLDFISNLFGFRTISSSRKVMKAISCISSLLPVRDGRLHIFHKSVKDWLTDTSCYGQHEFTVDQKEGCQVLSRLCETELNVMKRNGIQNSQFSDTEKYALQHGVQHMLEVMDDQVNPRKLKEIVESYVTDLELVYAKLCDGGTACSDDILYITKQKYYALLPWTVQCTMTTVLTVMRKHKPELRHYPQLFFQAMLNEGGQECASKASMILQKRYPEIPYVEILNKTNNAGERGIIARFECDSLVACFDVSPQMDYMVCECVNQSIQLWSLHTGDRQWSRNAFKVKPYIDSYVPSAFREVGGLSIDDVFGLAWMSTPSFHRSVVFHPNGEWLLPGQLSEVFTISGDLKSLFPTSSCNFTVCAFCGDKSKMLTDCPDNPKHAIMWNLAEGTEISRFHRRMSLSNFAFSPDGTIVAISDRSQHIGLYKVDYLNCELLCEITSPWTCALLHFSPSGQEIVCGTIIHDFCELEFHCLNYKVPDLNKGACERVSTLPCGQEKTDLSWWPWEFKSLDEGRVLFQNSEDKCGRNLSTAVSSFFRSGVFSLVSKESVLVGSPFSSTVFMVNPGQFGDVPAHHENIIDCSYVKISTDGNYLYLSDFEDTYSEREDDRYATVNVHSEEDNTSNIVRQFLHPFSLLPVGEGVLLLRSNNKLELWNFELSRCVRTVSVLDSLAKLFPVSAELVGCLGAFENGSSKVEILSVASGETVLTTSVQGNVTFISCNDSFQFVACTREPPGQPTLESIITVAVWNKRERLWKRSIFFEGHCPQFPSALISRNSGVVVTWGTFHQAGGIHILNAATGITIHKILADQNTFMDFIMDCTFLSDAKHFVCCSRFDQIVRLFNVISGELISLIDIGLSPVSLVACQNEPLFAVGLEYTAYKLFRVHFTEVKDSERKEKRIKLQS